MMNVSAPGGTERQQGEQPKERPFGPRVRPFQSWIGRPGGTLGSDERGNAHNHDHCQGGENNVLCHGIAHERDAFFQLLFILGVVGPRINGLAGSGRG